MLLLCAARSDAAPGSEPALAAPASSATRVARDNRAGPDWLHDARRLLRADSPLPDCGLSCGGAPGGARSGASCPAPARAGGAIAPCSPALWHQLSGGLVSAGARRHPHAAAGRGELCALGDSGAVFLALAGGVASGAPHRKDE